MTRKGVWLVMTLTAYALVAFGVATLELATSASIAYGTALLIHWFCS